MKRIFTLSILLVLLAAVLQAQNFWSRFQGPPGGSDMVLIRTANNTLYARQESNKRTLYRSVDLGNNWTEVTDITQSSSIDFSTFFVGAAGNMYYKSGNWFRSANAGQSWDSIPASSNISMLTESNAGSLIAYRSDKNLYRSVNAGQSWALANAATSIEYQLNALTQKSVGGLLATINQPGVNNRVYFRSTDDGQSWVRGEYSSSYTLIFISPNGNMFFRGPSNWLYRSTNGGQSVEAVSTNSPADDKIVFTPANWINGRMFMISNQKLFYSDYGGNAWDELPMEYSGRGLLRSVQELAPLPDSSVFCTIFGALFKSTDQGHTWHFSSNGIHKAISAYVEIAGDSSFLLSTAMGLWKTADRGQNWNLVFENKLYNQPMILQRPSNGGILLMKDNKLWYSSGNLDSLTDITPANLISDSGFFFDSIHQTIFIPITNGYWRSDNLGQAWTKYTGTEIRSPVFHPSGVCFAINKTRTKLLRSDNGGVAWTPFVVPGVTLLDFLLLKPDGSMLLQAGDGTNRHYLKSTDIGASWAPTGGGPPISNAGAIFDANGTLYTVDYKVAKSSADEGGGWYDLPGYELSNPYPQNSIGVGSLVLTRNQHLMVFSYDQDLYLSESPVTEGGYIRGRVRRDADADCSTPDAQEPLAQTAVEARGSFTYKTSTDPAGGYAFFVPLGNYDVAAISPNNVWWTYCDSVQNTEVTNLYGVDTVDFQALALSECPLMTVVISAPALRRCFEEPVYVQYCNRGAETADSAWVDVNIDPYLDFVGSLQTHQITAPKRVRFFVGDVQSGDCGYFHFTVRVGCDSVLIGQTHCITAHGFPDTLCVPVTNWSGASIEAAVSCQDTIVRLSLQNTGPATSQKLDYIIIEDDVVMLHGEKQYQPGELLSLPIQANGHTYRIESEQEPGHPFSNRALAFEEGCGGFATLGFINRFSVNGLTPSWNRLCRQNTGSYDPNDKQGFPTGAGAEHRIRPGQPIDYMIRFQNTGTDTAFSVVLRDTLSPWLDASSVLPGAASHAYTWSLGTNGALTVVFPNILLPDSSTNLAGSQGFVTFSIKQVKDVPPGTAIYNQAGIYFDFNAPVITNQTMHTVDVDPLPTSGQNSPSLRAAAVTVAPNPASSSAEFQWEQLAVPAVTLELFNPQGQLFKRVNTSAKRYLLERQNLPSGAYGWRLLDKQGLLLKSGVVVLD